jgi:hypothetical protein
LVGGQKRNAKGTVEICSSREKSAHLLVQEKSVAAKQLKMVLFKKKFTASGSTKYL